MLVLSFGLVKWLKRIRATKVSIFLSIETLPTAVPLSLVIGLLVLSNHILPRSSPTIRLSQLIDIDLVIRLIFFPIFILFRLEGPEIRQMRMTSNLKVFFDVKILQKQDADDLNDGARQDSNVIALP